MQPLQTGPIVFDISEQKLILVVCIREVRKLWGVWLDRVVFVESVASYYRMTSASSSEIDNCGASVML